VRYLDELLGSHGTRSTRCVRLVADQDEIVRRLRSGDRQGRADDSEGDPPLARGVPRETGRVPEMYRDRGCCRGRRPRQPGRRHRALAVFEPGPASARRSPPPESVNVAEAQNA
jgi:hypothetical protein